MGFRRYAFIFFCFLIYLSTTGTPAIGQYFVSGVIVNKETKEPVPYANITVKDLYRGTASNALGEFSFKTDSLPLILIITHVSFETKAVEIRRENDKLVIELVPGKLLMDELVVKAKGNSQYAYDLVKKAYYKILGRGSISRYGKAFYRQISKNGDDYSELYEIFYDTRYSNNGVDDWAIQEGRYAMKLSTIDSFIYNKNFTMLVRLLTVVQPKTDDLVMPVSELVDEQYDLHVEDVTFVNNRRLARISFEKVETVEAPAMVGELLIDTESYDLLKITGTIADDDLNFIMLKGEKGSWKNYKVSCEMAFKPVNDYLALDYMSLGQNFEYYQEGVFLNNVETRAFFTYYEYYEPPKKKRLGGRLMRFGQRDSDVLDAIGYNQLFWDENIVVKRTPVEAEVIKSFEKERAFGSIYLNNRNQVVLEDYLIDSDPYVVQVREVLKDYDLPVSGQKVFMHLDRPGYVAGQTVWWKAYVANMATNVLAPKPGILNVALYSPEGIAVLTQSFKIQDGMATGSLSLPPKLKSGLYILKSNTSFMARLDDRFAYEKKLHILNSQDDTITLTVPKYDTLKTLMLNAEGGRLIKDVAGQVGFLSLDEYGQPAEMRGRITDQQGRMISQLKTDFNGFGSTFLLPSGEVNYKIEIPAGYREPVFPEISSAGYSIMVNNLKTNAIDITVRGTIRLEGKKFYILVVSNGALIDRRIGMITKGIYKTEIPKANFPNGIAQMFLVDDLGEIQCRRQIFVEQPHQTAVRFYLAKKDLAPKERIDMVIEINDENGKPVNGADMSMSVLDKEKLQLNASDENMRTYLDFGYMLDHDIAGPANLLGDDEREPLKKFEFMMLNQKTVLPEINSFEKTDKKQKSVLRDADYQQFSGRAINMETGKPLVNGYLSLVSYPDPSLGSWYVRTDDSGVFSLDNFFQKDSLSLSVRSLAADGTPVEAVLEINISGVAKPLTVVEIPVPAEARKILESYRLTNEQDFSESLSARMDDRSVVLQTSPYGKPDQRFNLDNRIGQDKRLIDFFSPRESGTEISADGSILIKGDGVAPIILIDGVLVNPEVLAQFSSGKSVINPWAGEGLDGWRDLPIDQFDKIEIVKKANLVTFYGTEWTHGIINVYSRSGSSMVSASVQTKPLQWLPGLSKSSTYQSPDYSKTPASTPDVRTLIYWNPDIKLNKKGRAKISFYNTDDARTLQICIQGITTSGVAVFDLFDIGKGTTRTR